jgi:phage terminase large subunit-like protein
MPWQRDALDILCEIDPETGGYWYRTFVLILPRQGGKTTLIRGKMAHRAITQPGSQILYTAQDRNKARQRLEETIYNPLSMSPLAATLGRPRWAAGSEAIRWRNRSICRIESLSLTAGHGDTLDEAYIDEAFAHKDHRIEQNVNPTMITVQGAQKLITSAAGGAESAFLMVKRDRGRALVAMGKDSRTAYIEYSAPLEADPDDPATYMAAHPAITHTIQLQDVINERYEMDAEEFERAYLGWWPIGKGQESPIPLSLWKSNFIDPNLDTWTGTPIWSVDVSPDRQWASISLAARSWEIGKRCFVEVIDHEPGTHWIIDRLEFLRAKFGGNIVMIDGAGAAGSLREDLESTEFNKQTGKMGPGFQVIALTANERAAACGAFYDDSVQGKLSYLDDPELNKAMVNATKVKALGGESWIFSRGRSQVDISPLYSVAIARFGFVKYGGFNYDPMDSVA